MSKVSLINGHIDGSNTCVICGKTEPKDMVEVVRCKDCKYLIKKPSGRFCVNSNNLIFNTVLEVNENHFCSYGERKETE